MKRKVLFACALPAVLLAATLAAQATEAPDGTHEWHVGLALGTTHTRGNSDTLLANVSLTGTRETEKHMVRLGIEGAYGENETEREDGTREDEVTAQHAKGYANLKRTFGRSYAYADASLSHDDVAEVDYRLIAGPGLGYFLLQNDTSLLGIDLGASYVGEKVDGLQDEYWALRIGERLDWNISDTTHLWQAAEYLPRIDDFEDYLVSAEVGLEAAINARLSLRVVVQDKYDNTPAEGLEHNDITTIAAVVWKLR